MSNLSRVAQLVHDNLLNLGKAVQRDRKSVV
jgi:hypothetical protein